MKKIILFLVIITSVCIGQRKNLPGLYYPAMTNDGKNIYLFGGMTDDTVFAFKQSQPQNVLFELVNDLWIYMPDVNVWELEEEEKLSEKPLPRVRHIMTADADKAVLTLYGGDNSTNVFFNDIWEYDIINKVWTYIEQTNKPKERVKCGIVALDTDLVVLGGVDYSSGNEEILYDMWYYNMNSKIWIQKNNIPNTIKEINGVARIKSKNKIFVYNKGVSGGSFFNNKRDQQLSKYDNNSTISFNIYNEITGVWSLQTTTGEIPKDRYYGMCISAGNKIYVGMGYTAEGVSKDFYELDTDTWIWKKLSDLPKKLAGFACTVMNNKIYVFGGIDSSYKKTNDFFVFNIVSNKWSELSNRIIYRPQSPSNLTATENEKHQIVLNWKDNSNNEKGFKILREKVNVSIWEEIKNLPENHTSFVDSTVLENSTYRYKIQAYNDDGNSEFSNIVEINTSKHFTKPNAPTNLRIKENKKTVELKWDDNSSNEDGFKVERKLYNINEWSEIGNTKENEVEYIDKTIEEGKHYEYRVAAFNTKGVSGYTNIVSIITTDIRTIELPLEFRLYQNYPNPFNPSTKIKFSIDKDEFIKLTIYDILGREIKILVNEHLNKGLYEINWDAYNMSSGIYYYKLVAGNRVEIKKMVLSR